MPHSGRRGTSLACASFRLHSVERFSFIAVASVHCIAIPRGLGAASRYPVRLDESIGVRAKYGRNRIGFEAHGAMLSSSGRLESLCFRFAVVSVSRGREIVRGGVAMPRSTRHQLSGIPRVSKRQRNDSNRPKPGASSFPQFKRCGCSLDRTLHCGKLANNRLQWPFRR